MARGDRAMNQVDGGSELPSGHVAPGGPIGGRGRLVEPADNATTEPSRGRRDDGNGGCHIEGVSSTEAADVDSSRALRTAISREVEGARRSQKSLVATIEAFAAVIGDPVDALDCIARMRQSMLLEGSVDRSSIDQVIDRVLRHLVEVMFADVQSQALTDPLTGLGNRRSLVRDLRTESARAVRAGTPLSLAVIDVDGLKQLNDDQGHAAGDEALRKLAAALLAVGRATDRAYRHGGDEFALLMVDAAITDPSILENRLRRSGAPRCSLGVATSLSDPIDELAAIADRRLYARRRAVRLHTPRGYTRSEPT